MPKTIKKRVPKKSATAEEEVKDKLSGLTETIRKRQRIVAQYGIIVLVLIAAAAGFFAYSFYAQKKAKGLQYEGYKAYYNISKTTLSKEEQYKKSLDLFQKAFDTRKSPLSLFYVAASYYELGRYDDAVKTLKEFTDRYSSEEQMLPLVYQKMAAAYIKKGDMNGAKKALEDIGSLKRDTYKDYALMEHARLLEKEGKGDEAKKKYQELATKYPDSPFAGDAKAKLSGGPEKKEGSTK
ncbi:MAG: tetratricopeptide repeat protein [Nitrospirota bacterium]